MQRKRIVIQLAGDYSENPSKYSLPVLGWIYDSFVLRTWHLRRTSFRTSFCWSRVKSWKVLTNTFAFCSKLIPFTCSSTWNRSDKMHCIFERKQIGTPPLSPRHQMIHSPSLGHSVHSVWMKLWSAVSRNNSKWRTNSSERCLQTTWKLYYSLTILQAKTLKDLATVLNLKEYGIFFQLHFTVVLATIPD